MSDDDNTLIAQRRAKLAEWRDAGTAYPNDFRPLDVAGELQARHADDDKAALEAAGARVTVAGRMMSRRIMGKASFAGLRDVSGDIQLFVQRDAIGTEAYDAFKRYDLGDILGVEGLLFRTKTDELSIRVEQVRLLVKSLRPLPEKFHGLSDTEMRYRQRYVDLIVNEETRATFRLRSHVVAGIRRFFEARDFLEVETPMMQTIPSGAAATPFRTHHNALGIDLFLRIAPELYLKRLVVGGFERVFEINRNFRNEGLSTRHNPEFTMLEFYQAYADFEDLMTLTEDLIHELAAELLDDGRVDPGDGGDPIDLSKPFRRLALADAVLEYNDDLDADSIASAEALRAVVERHDVKVEAGWGRGRLLTELFEATVEDRLREPTYITHYPTEVSPLSRRRDADPDVTDRFELFIAGREVANGFSELNDPDDQRARFEAQLTARAEGDEEAMPGDPDYIRALEYGMPPTAGEGIGIDRLVMLFAGVGSIRDVILFPHMRPERAPGGAIVGVGDDTSG